MLSKRSRFSPLCDTYLARSQEICSFSQVETRNRFRCLRSKPVDVEEKKEEREVIERSVLINEESLRAQSPRTQSLREREIFHDTFSFLIKLVNILLQDKLELNQMRFITICKIYSYFLSLTKLYIFFSLRRGAQNGIVVVR